MTKRIPDHDSVVTPTAAASHWLPHPGRESVEELQKIMKGSTFSIGSRPIPPALPQKWSPRLPIIADTFFSPWSAEIKCPI